MIRQLAVFRAVVVCSVVLIACGPFVAADQAAATEQRRPNIVFFLVDDLGWTDLGCYGSRLYDTPHIDQFAADSVRFTDAYAACHVCSPTRASILTGKYPARLQLTDWLPGRRDFAFQRLLNAPVHQALPAAEVTIAEVLKQAGYRTAHIGKWHLGEPPLGPTSQGFDVQIPRWNRGWPKAGYHAPFELEGLSDQPGDYLTDRLTDEAVEFIQSSSEAPFLLYLSHFAVHDPIQGPADLVQKYQTRLASLPKPAGPEFILEANPDAASPPSADELSQRLQQPSGTGYRMLPDRTVKIKQHQDNAEFAAMVESVDRSLGRILSTLQRLELADDTIVMLFSDNGGMSAANFGRPERVIAEARLDEAFSTSNLPLRGGKGWLYEGGIRVPLIIHWPGAAGNGSDCHVPVISTDFFPTIQELVGLPQPADQPTDGVSLVPLLQGRRTLPREALYWHFPHYSNHGGQSPGGAVRAGDYKLLQYFENGTVQLFNLRTDPGEQYDLAAAQPDRVQALQRLLEDWRKQVSAARMDPNPDFTQAR